MTPLYKAPTLTRVHESDLTLSDRDFAKKVRAHVRSQGFKQAAQIQQARRHVAVGTQTRKKHEVLTR